MTTRRSGKTIGLGLGLLLVTAGGLFAQPVVELTDELTFDRPEAWALKFFNSVSLLTALGPPVARQPGSVELGLEVGWIPHLDAEQRQVGFGGNKDEDLNKLPVLARPRLTVGLPGKLALTASYVPPLTVNGVEPELLAVALERPLIEPEPQGSPWGLGARLYAQVGELEGDFTCPQDILAFPPGSEENLFGCEARSADEVQLDHVGFELVGSYHFGGGEGSSVYLGLGTSFQDMEFQVNARTFGFLDRTLLLADGFTYSIHGGFTRSLTGPASFGVELFYAPLSVKRLGAADSDNDALLNVRAMISYRLR